MKDEKDYLINTRKIIYEELVSKKKNIDEEEKDIYEINSYIWEKLKVLSDGIDVIEQGFLDSQAKLKHDEVIRDAKKIALLKKSYKNAYFGRIDFKSDNIVDKVYVGYTNIVKDDIFYVYDWRSPISSLFYNYGVGKSEYEAPMGTIKGETLLKRQYKINNDEIIRCFDSNINIDDDYLQEILSKSKSDKMTNIVNTIQIDQNRIIRNDKDDYLIVEGIAGSGKTSVGLHRIAYLLYKNLNLSSNNIVILSPNDIFSKYISNVLPELGEDNVLQTTFSSFYDTFLKNEFKIEHFTSYLERIYNEKNNNQIKYKFSNRIIDDLKNFINAFNDKLHFKTGLTIKGIHYSKEDVNNYLLNRCNNLTINEKLDKVTNYLCNMSKVKKKGEKKRIKETIYNILCFNLDLTNLYNMFASYIKKYYDIEIDMLSDNKIKYEDLSILLYIKFELFGYPYDINIKHMVIDEAQDYSMLQYLLLKRTFYKSSFTILGDTNQSINKYVKYKSLNEITELFNNSIYLELNKTYRSTKEIIDYTNKILNIDNACSVRRENDIKVIEKEIESKNIIKELIEDIDDIKNNGFKSIAIIAKDVKSSKSIFDKLITNKVSVSLLKDKGNETINEIVVVPSVLCKGLEYDAVIVVNTSDDKYNEEEMNLFYVVCTRAQHQLIIYNK